MTIFFRISFANYRETYYFINCYDLVHLPISSTRKLGHEPNFSWRRIFTAKRVVQKGARWKIRSGSKFQFFMLCGQKMGQVF